MVSPDEAGLRLDQAVARNVAALSRRKARVVIELGGVFVDGARVKVLGRGVRPGQRIEVHVGGALERASGELGAAARARDAAGLPTFSVVHEDDDVVVVDKPSGLLSAPTPESDRNNLADLLERRTAPRSRHWVVHRLDLETSGLLVLAKTEAANRALSAAFRVHDVDRQYLAVVDGRLSGSPGRIDAAIAGRPAVSHVSILQVRDATTLVRVRLETGRTHQVRIHLESIGHPVCGDPRYGVRSGVRAPRLALHAAGLGFAHPRSGERLRFESPWPSDLKGWLVTL